MHGSTTRKSKRLQSKPVVNFKDGSNDDLDSEEEYEVESESDGVEEEDLDMIPSSSKDLRKKSKGVRPLTDDEEEDSVELRNKRHQSQYELRAVIEKCLNGSADTNEWVADEKDEEDLYYYIELPVTLSSHKIVHGASIIPPEVFEILQNRLPVPDKFKKYIARTGHEYAGYFKRLMYMWEADLKKYDPELLDVDGRLHIRQFFNFGEDNFVQPQSISDYMTRFPVTTRQKVLDAFIAFLDTLYVKADSAEGRGKFCKLKPTEVDEEMDKTTRREIGKRKLNEFLAEINAMKTSLKIGKPYLKLQGLCANEKKKKQEISNYYEGLSQALDPTLILAKWLQSESTMKMNMRILELAANKEVVSSSELNVITNHMIILINCLNGHRKQIYGDLTRGDYIEGKARGRAANPNSQLHLNSKVNKKPEVMARTTVDQDGYKRYHRDPYLPDPLDPNDVMQDDNVWSIAQGVCFQVKFHKTGHKFPAYIFVNLVDEVVLSSYEEISANYLTANGISFNNDSPFFISGSGRAFINVSTGIDLTDFAVVTEIPRATNHLFRLMVSNHLLGSNSGNFVIQVECLL